MSERTSGGGQSRPETPDCGISINASTNQPPMFEALCLCGFMSEYVDDRRRAVQAGRHHIESERPIGYLPTDLPLVDGPLEVLREEPDPLMTPCPEWCVVFDEFHRISSCDEDRYHFSEIVRVPMRHVQAEWFAGGDSYTLGHVQLYLRHDVLAAAPTVRADLNDSAVGTNLTLDEAEAIGRTLLAMVEAAR